MSIGEFIAQLWLSITILSVIVVLSIFCIVHVLRSTARSCSKTWTDNERARIRWLTRGTTIAVVLCWIGAVIAASDAPLSVNGTINLSLFNGDTHILDVIVLGVIAIGLPALATAFWLKLLRHNWADGEAPTVSSYFFNYSLWLALIWSKLLIGWTN
jgi:hypothetical protein